jgi:enoyl-CoA hydratase
MIRVEDRGAIRQITLARAEKANALTRDMLEALDEAVASATDARVLILTGEGRVFSAGADLEAARAGLAVDPVWDRLSNRIAGFAGLSIAALNGTMAGGGIGMALACDLRVAAVGAEVFYPVMKLGFLPQPADPARLVALVGPARAAMILMTGHRVGTEEAEAWGLFDRVVPKGEEVAAAEVLGAQVLASAPGHAAAIKGMLRRAAPT